MKLSPKKQQQLYDAVHQECMTTRIAIRKALQGFTHMTFNAESINKIDDFLSDLCMKAPITAIKIFKEPTKKEAPAVHSAFKGFAELWGRAYPELGFNAVTGAKLKEMIAATEHNLQLAGKVSGPNECVYLFNYALKYVERERHYVHGKPITQFAQQYPSILRELKHGKEPKPSNNAADVRDFAANL